MDIRVRPYVERRGLLDRHFVLAHRHVARGGSVTAASSSAARVGTTVTSPVAIIALPALAGVGIYLFTHSLLWGAGAAAGTYILQQSL